MGQNGTQTGVSYHIGVRGFQDSTGDGVGDQAGVADRLRYVAELGVDTILLDQVLERDLIGAASELGLYATSEIAPPHALLGGPWDATAVRTKLDEVYAANESPTWSLTPLDPAAPRPAGLIDPDKARLAALLLLTLRGTPVIRYGDEIGLEGTGDLPMQWDSSPSAGFTKGTPGVEVDSAAVFRNVSVQSDQPDSLLNLYRRILKLRGRIPALRYGSFDIADAGATGCFSYLREAPQAPGHFKRIFVALNFSADPAHVILPAPGRVLLWTHAPGEDTNLVEVLHVGPNQGAVAVLFA